MATAAWIPKAVAMEGTRVRAKADLKFVTRRKVEKSDIVVLI